MKKVGKGPSSDFVQLWAETEPELLRMALRFGLKDRARDVVQDVAVLALSRHGEFSEPDEFRKWARARVYWFSLDRMGKGSQVGLENLGANLGVAPLQEDAAIAEQLWESVQELPPRQRAVIEKSIYGDSMEEIAQSLNIAAATVRSLLRFARRSLFQRFTEGERK